MTMTCSPQKRTTQRTFSERSGQHYYYPSRYQRRSLSPRTNILKDDHRWIIELALPGVVREDIELRVDEDILTISQAKAKIDENKTYYRREFDTRSFTKKFRIDTLVDTDKIEASMHAGILRISLPLKEEALPKPPKNIQIQ